MDEQTQELKVSLFQLNSTASIEHNQRQINELIDKYNSTHTDLWTFPECALHRPQNQTESRSFSLDDTIIPWFQNLAKTHKKWILVGSFFLKQKNKSLPTNSSVVINPSGDIIQTYDKLHLFDVSLNSLSFCESKSFQAGTTPKTVDINSFLCGLSICFDCRFPELYRHYSKNNCDILFIPSSFTKTTGQRHWHTLCIARAIENQCYVIAPNQCGLGANSAPTYGHSLIIDPFGEIISEASEENIEVIHATLNKSKIQSTRQLFPLLNARKL